MFGLSIINKILEKRSLRLTVKISILGLMNNIHRDDIRKFRFVNFVAEEKNRLVYASWLGKITYPVFFYFNDQDCLEQVWFKLEYKDNLGMGDDEKNRQVFEMIDKRIISPLINRSPIRSDNIERVWEINKVSIQLLCGDGVRLILEKDDDTQVNAN
jgi:hypothetical protein